MLTPGYQGAAVFVGVDRQSSLEANVTVRNCTMESNVARNASDASVNYGGALYAAEGLKSVFLRDLVMLNNSAREGGSVFLNGPFDVAITGCRFDSNTGIVQRNFHTVTCNSLCNTASAAADQCICHIYNSSMCGLPRCLRTLLQLSQC